MRPPNSQRNPTAPAGAPRWVCGFLFNPRIQHVLLIEKRQGPPQLLGHLNGVGGKLEPGESAHDAMVREFREEAGVQVPQWRHFASLTRMGTVAFFTANADTYQYANVRACTNEPVLWIDWSRLYLYNIVPNLKWLVPMALDNDVVQSEIIST